MANKAINSLTYGSDTYIFTLPYGTCGVAAGTAAKTVTVANSKFSLENGAKVTVKFTNANTVASPTLNVNSTGDKAIYWHGAALPASQYWQAGAVLDFVYNGTQWDLIGVADISTLEGLVGDKSVADQIADATPLSNGSSQAGLIKTSSTVTSSSGYTACPVISGVPYFKNTTYSNASLGQGYGTCATAAATTAKVVTLSSYALVTGGIVSVKFDYAVPANATMNINSKGAKAIYYKGKAIVDGVICAGEVATFIYNGSQYHLLTVDRSRFFTSLVPYGTAIPESADLNTITYLKVGNYYCSSNATAKTLVNCPTVTTGSDGTKSGVAFMMSVSSPLSQTVDDETGTWKYRFRRLQVYNGPEYVQYCYSNGTAGNWIYGDWQVVVKAPQGESTGGPSTPIYINSNGNAVECTSGFTGATSSTAGKVGLVPAPAAGKQASFLRGDGTWAVPTDTDTVTTATTSGSGNAVTAISASNGALTVTKGTTFATKSELDTVSGLVGDTAVSTQITNAIGAITPASIGAAASSHGTHVSYGTSATAVGATAGAGSASTVSRSDHTHSLSKSAVTTALGYTPPTSDTNTTYTFASGDSNGQIKVTPSGGTAQNVSVTGLAAAAYKGVTDSTAAGVIGTGTNLVTERDVYYGLPKFNNSKTYTSSSTYYAPATAGASGNILVSAGSGAPTWKSLIDAGILPLSGGTLTGTLTVPEALSISKGTYTPRLSFQSTTNTETSSIIETSSGILDVNGVEFENGRINMQAGLSIRSYNNFGTRNPLIWLSANSDGSGSHHLVLGHEDASTCHTGHTYIYASNGHVYLINGGGSVWWEDYSDVSTEVYGVFRPGTTKKASLGRSGALWYKVWAATSSIQTSDEREKSDIMAIADYPVTYSRDGSGNIWEKLFKKLVPKTYTLDIEESNHLNIGFVAQDIEKSMEELGLTVDDLALIDHSYWTDEETGEEKDSYGLAYEQFIALNTYMIQKQQDKIATLEERIAQLEELVNSN